MRILRLRVADFRNIAFADLDFGGARRIFLTGKNGQGKTNLLETASLLTALRSFRTRESRLLVRHGQKLAQIFFALEHEREGGTDLTLSFSSLGTKVAETGAGTQVKRLSEFVGRFPVVVFSSDDIALLRGSPSVRRRWLDMTLSAINPEYFLRLQNYHRALDSRNRLLKFPGTSERQFDAFEKTLAENGAKLVEMRSREMEAISALFADAAAKIAQTEESPELVYAASISAADAAAHLEHLQRSRATDKLLRATQRGPHRDDFRFRIFGRAAEDFASEGQQRGMTLSLGLAQIALFRARLGIAPVVLADDVLGELDSARRAGFWSAVGADLQVIATGTREPDDAAAWLAFRVEDGQYFREI